MKDDNPGQRFERLTAETFQLLGYSVNKDVLIAGSQIDILLGRTTGPLAETYVVECKDYANPVSVTLVRAFHSSERSVLDAPRRLRRDGLSTRLQIKKSPLRLHPEAV
jgi:hypothetical protein